VRTSRANFNFWVYHPFNTQHPFVRLMPYDICSTELQELDVSPVASNLTYVDISRWVWSLSLVSLLLSGQTHIVTWSFLSCVISCVCSLSYRNCMTSLPDWLSDSKKLEVLDVSHNNISELPPWWVSEWNCSGLCVQPHFSHSWTPDD